MTFYFLFLFLISYHFFNHDYILKMAQRYLMFINGARAYKKSLHASIFRFCQMAESAPKQNQDASQSAN